MFSKSIMSFVAVASIHVAVFAETDVPSDIDFSHDFVILTSKMLDSVSDCKYVYEKNRDFGIGLPCYVSKDVKLTRDKVRCIFIEYMKLNGFDFLPETNGVVHVNQYKITDRPIVAHDDTMARNDFIEKVKKQFGDKSFKMKSDNADSSIWYSSLIKDTGAVIICDPILQKAMSFDINEETGDAGVRKLVELLAPKDSVEILKLNDWLYATVAIAERQKIAKRLAAKTK